MLEFCLKQSEFGAVNGQNAPYAMRNAAKRVYETEKFKNRGEFGELILHAVLRQVFGTIPAISKIYYKDSSNDTVKGFDAVHVIENGDELELWIGEVKFYSNISKAVTDVVKELEIHTNANYLRSEFLAITNKIDDKWARSEQLRLRLHENNPLDEIFARTCIPVLLTYDSDVLPKHVKNTDEYRKEIEEEFIKNWRTFSKHSLPDVRIHLILIPLNTKAALIEELDRRLGNWKQI
jgi:Domain of unknown function (DUF1837).